MRRLHDLLLVALTATALLTAACNEGESPTAPSDLAQAAKPAAGLRVTPPQLSFSGTGVSATVSATSSSGPITAQLSSGACATVDLKSVQQKQTKFTVTAIAPGTCTITVADGAGGSVNVSVQVAATVVPTSLAAGAFHTCGLDVNGAAWCWGYNGWGQLGNANTIGTTTANPAPEPVVGGLSFASLTGGFEHTCGLTPAGAAYCWGRNTFGQLGNPTNSGAELGRNPMPLPVSGNLTFAALEAGADHTCGLTTAGVMYCWGKNWQGQLGRAENNLTNTPNPTPTAVDGSLTFSAVGAGTDHTCGVSGGVVYCWGDNSFGQIGTDQDLENPLATHPAPAPVQGAPSVASLAIGGHFSCGLTSAGAAWCWGDNNAGALGAVTESTRNFTPVAVSGGLSFASIGAGGGHVCGRTTGAGSVYCWGGNLLGQLGTALNSGSGTPNYQPIAASVAPLAVLAINAAHSCGLTSTGTALCWGFNRYGQLGSTTNTNVDAATPEPQPVLGGLTFATQ